MAEDIVIPASNYARGLATIDQIFECFEAAKLTPHLRDCTRGECEVCRKWREEHDKCLNSANQLLRRLFDLLMDRPVEPVSLPASVRQPRKSRRRFDLQKLNDDGARLETLFQIGDSWKRLGDLDAKDCGALARRYQALETAGRIYKDAFTELKVVLVRKKAATVRDVFTEQRLGRLLEGVVLEETKQGWRRLEH